MASSSPGPSMNRGPPFVTTHLPENNRDGPPLSTLAEDLWEAMFTWAKSKEEQMNRDCKLKLERDFLILFFFTFLVVYPEFIDVIIVTIICTVAIFSVPPVFSVPAVFAVFAVFVFTNFTVAHAFVVINSTLAVVAVAVAYDRVKFRKEFRAMEMILHWIDHGGKEALKQAEKVLEKRRVKPTDIKQHSKQLLELIEQEYWHTQHPTSSHTDDPSGRLSVPVNTSNEIIVKFLKSMREEIFIPIYMHQSLGLRYITLEAQLSNMLDKILRLSSWTPSSTHNKHLRELLRNALLMLNDLGGSKEYHDDLRDFMKRHTAFCAFTLDNSHTITAEDSERTADLCKNLRRLAQNLGKIASTKAENYQNLYDIFMAHKEDLSHWLDLASLGQGRSLVNKFMDSLKGMVSSMRREANFWNSQSNQFHKWPNIKQTYGRAIDAMPSFPSDQLNDHRCSTTPSIQGSVTQNAEHEPQCVPQVAQRVLATFTNLQKLRVNTTQAFLAKSENSISKRMRETRGYLELVVDVAGKQLPQSSEERKVIARFGEKALCITKRWNKLQRKVKYWGSILSIFSKPLAYQTFDMMSGISRDDFLDRVIASPDTLIHPYVIEFELCLRDMWHHFLSRTHFWALVDSDPATFTSWHLAFLNEI